MSETVTRLERVVAQQEQSRTQPLRNTEDNSEATEMNKQQIRSLSCPAVCLCLLVSPSLHYVVCGTPLN